MPAETHSPIPPSKECDLVMKGGITSGVVYPSLVLELAEEYSFRSIGGSSAGAIAAVLAAAAEYSRSNGGFQRLKEVSAQLRRDGFVRHLFKSTGRSRLLFQLFTAATDRTPGSGPSDERSLGSRVGEMARVLATPILIGFVVGALFGVGWQFLAIHLANGDLAGFGWIPVVLTAVLAVSCQRSGEGRVGTSVASGPLRRRRAQS